MLRQRALNSIAAACFTLVPLTAASQAVIVASDDFEAGTHHSGNRSEASGMGIRFFTRDGASAVDAAIAADAAFGSQSLVVTDLNPAPATNKPVIGLLPMTLQLANVNDSISLSFQFHFVNNSAVTANAANFRFGIFSSTGTPVTADSQLTSDNDRGYYVQVGSSGSTVPSTGNVLYNEGGTILPILASTDRLSITANRVGFAINNNDIHSAVFTLTRVSLTAISLSFVLDGGPPITGTDSSANLRTSFDEIAFTNGFQNPNLSYVIDNVAVSVTVPEPASSVLFAAGVIVCSSMRPRRRIADIL